MCEALPRAQENERAAFSVAPISSFVIFSSNPWEKADNVNNLELKFNRKAEWKKLQPNFCNFIKCLWEMHLGSILGQ